MTSESADDGHSTTSRRAALGWVAMLGSLAVSYGLFSAFSLRFIYPKRRQRRKAKMFVTFADEVPALGGMYFTTPDGEEYVLTQTDSAVTPYRAYSSRCPHLGCKVHWEDASQQFICPCHGGAFDSNGQATAGPPLKAEQKLKPCEIVRDDGVIYALVETT
jgi:cytochrome b6-f complex iron-sulfur subunit